MGFKKLSNGLFLSFEGLDGSAKGTHVKKLTKHLEDEGYTVVNYAFPQYETLTGKVIASYLRGEFGDINSVPHELLCIAYAADRAKVKEEIAGHLYEGHIVLADRYTYSNLFSAGKMEPSKREQFIKWIEEMEFKTLRVVKPDYNFLLYVDPNISIQRIAERGKRDYQNGAEDIHENNKQLLVDTADTYLHWALTNQNWVIINQMKDKKQLSIDVVFEMLKNEVNSILQKKN